MGRTWLLAAVLVVTGCTDAPAEPRPGEAGAASGAADVGRGVAALRSCDGPAEPVTALPLPEGVVAVRICEAMGNFSWQAPKRVLTERVDDLVRHIDVQPRWETGQGCQKGGGVGFDLRMAYADGSVLSLPGTTGGCRTLAVRESAYEGAPLVRESFLAGLRAQRGEVRDP